MRVIVRPPIVGRSVCSMLHWKKSHKGNWEVIYLFVFPALVWYLVTLEEIPQRELRVFTKHPSLGQSLHQRYIGRNPTKGIESLLSMLGLGTLCFCRLHWKKSHKGNWEPMFLFSIERTRYVRLHWKKSHKGNWELSSILPDTSTATIVLCYIGRNPTKGIESRELLPKGSQPRICSVTLEEIPQRELRAPTHGYSPRASGLYVTLEEIPQRELRAVWHSTSPRLGTSGSRYIGRNPTKGLKAHKPLLSTSKELWNVATKHPERGFLGGLRGGLSLLRPIVKGLSYKP